MKKTYAGYTTEQLKDLIEFFLQFRTEKSELFSDIKQNKEKFFTKDYPNAYWSSFYQLSFSELTYLMIILTGLKEFFENIVKSKNPQEEFVEKISKQLEEEESALDLEKDNVPLILSVLIAHGYTMDSISYSGKSLNCLYQEAKSGNFESFKDMLVIDRSCINIPGLHHYFGKAQLLNNKEFYKQALVSTQRKIDSRRDDFAEVRFILYALEEKKIISSLSQKERYQLLVKELNVYKDSPDALNNINKFITRWLKEAETDFSISVSDTFLAKIHIVFSHILNDIGENKVWKQRDTIDLLTQKGMRFKKNKP